MLSDTRLGGPWFPALQGCLLLCSQPPSCQGPGSLSPCAVCPRRRAGGRRPPQAAVRVGTPLVLGKSALNRVMSLPSTARNGEGPTSTSMAFLLSPDTSQGGRVTW